MKKKRFLPFGYRMVNGKIEIVPEETELVQKIYTKYIAGVSLNELAKMAELTGLKFSENTSGWNKNKIARMLDDQRYWHGENFPSIISTDMANTVSYMRKSRATASCDIRFISEKVICHSCGGKLSRNRINTKYVYWDCPICKKDFGSIPDYKLLEMATERFLMICSEPQMVEPKSKFDNSLSMQTARLRNEINQMLDQREVDQDRLLSLILECAAEKYKTCGIKKSDHRTIKIKALFQEHRNDERLDRELFEQTVKQVILQPDGSIQFQLLNGKTI